MGRRVMQRPFYVEEHLENEFICWVIKQRALKG